jgi:pre-mRNA-splicing factor 18
LYDGLKLLVHVLGISAEMDFASLMKKELSKSKKSSDGGKTYLKRSEIEEQREAAYLDEQKGIEEERQAKILAKRKLEEESSAETAAREEKRQKLAEESRKRREDEEWEKEQARRKRLGLPERERKTSQDAEQDVVEGMEDIPEEELVGKLRAIGQPVIVFGEGHAARLRRYRKLTTVMTTGPIPTTLKLVDEKDMKVDGTTPKDKEGRLWLFRQLASYFTMVLTAYQGAMEAEKQDTSASRQAYSTMVQTRENMKPVRIATSLRGDISTR